MTFIILTLAVALVQGCGSKSTTENTTKEIPVVKTATLTPAERRAKVDKDRAERIERRRAEEAERARTMPTYKDASGSIVYNKAELYPAFVGGDEAMGTFLNDNVKYPKVAEDKGLEGTVIVDFIVGRNGVVYEVGSTDGLGENVHQSLRDEAIRVVKSMPKWTPGRQRGRAVAVKYSVPITFHLN